MRKSMDFFEPTDRKRIKMSPARLFPNDPPEWDILEPMVGHFSLKYYPGFLYINPREIQIGSGGPNRIVNKLLLKTPMSDEHIKHVVEKYDINIDFSDIRPYKPLDLFFLYFMEELLGTIVEYQAPFYDFGPPPANDILGTQIANDNFWNYLFKQIKIVSRKQKEPSFRPPTEEEEIAQADARAKQGAVKHREAEEKMKRLMRSPEAESIRLQESEYPSVAEHILRAGRRTRRSKK